MKHLIALALIIFISITTVGQIDSASHFPQDFFGIYKGILHINSENGIKEIPIEFHMQATDSIKQFTYTLVYGEGDTRQERKYTLKEKDKDSGIYVVDENNGIVLDIKVVNNCMYTLFEVNGSLLTTFITFEKDYMV